MSTSNIQFDSNGTATEWCGNGNCSCGDSRYRVSTRLPIPAPLVVIPEYKGEYRSRMQEWSYPRKRNPAFASPKKPKCSLGRKSGTQSTPTEQASSVPVGDKPAYEALKGRDNRSVIVDAYAGYLANTVSKDNVFAAVTKFAKKKISGKWLHGLAKLGETEEDVVQDIVLALVNNFDKFEGTPADFFSWVHKAVFNRGIDAKKKAKVEEDRHAFLFLINEDGEDGEDAEYDNPLMYPDERPQYQRKLPDFIQGVDLQICLYIREDYDYAKIAQVLSMTVDAVTNRVRKMREKYLAMKAQGLL